MSFWRPQPELPARPGGEQRRQPMIVVADDDRDTRELYRAFFDLSGFRTAEAATGNQALLMARRLLPDVLLTDLVLPDLDGLSVARALKIDQRTAGIRILLVTGYCFDGLTQLATDAGIDRALAKPCLPHIVLREVERALLRSAPSRAASEHPLSRRDVPIGDEQDNGPGAIVDPQRQNF